MRQLPYVREVESEVIELLRELQGAETQVQFASRLGIDQPELSRLLRGERRPARRVILGLLRAFPERRTEIITALTADPTNPVEVA